MKRTHQILAAILVVQIILGVVVFWPRAAVSSGGEPVFPDLDPEAVVALTITDEVGKRVDFRKEGDAWVYVSGGDYPANAESITSILDKIHNLNTLSLVTRTSASHERLQVAGDSFVARVDFQTSDGSEYTLYLGSSPRYTATHFRVAGQNETYLTTEISSWELSTSVSSWIDTQYFETDKEKLTQIELENASGTLTFVKEDEDWTLADLAEDEAVDTAAITTLINRSTNIVMQRPLGKDEKAAYGLSDPLATVTLKSNGGTNVLSIGTQDPGDSSYVLKASSSDYFVRVASYNAQSFVENTREDFLVEETEDTNTDAESTEP